MQIQYGFTSLTATHVIALTVELERGEWASVDALPLDQLTPETPTLVLLKSALIPCIQAVLKAELPDTISLDELDQRWDRAQRRLALRIQLAQHSEVAAERDAAALLAKELLSGPSGTQQTSLTYREQVEFGTRQLVMLDGERIAAAAALLDLAPYSADIRDANDALRLAIDGPNSLLEPRWSRQRAALRAAAAQLNQAAATLDTLAKNPDHDAQDRVARLKAPLTRMLDR